MTDHSFLIIGDSNLARRVRDALTARGRRIVHLVAPDDAELRAALHRSLAGIAILTHDDLVALRYALSCAHLLPEVPMVVTVFDRTVGDQLEVLLPQCLVTSPADLAAPALAGPCIAEGLLAAGRAGDAMERIEVLGGLPVRRRDKPLRKSLWRTATAHVAGLLRTPDQGTRMLSIGLFGMLAILILDWLWLVFGEHQAPHDALLHAVRVVTTVGPAADAHDHPRYAVAASAAMLATVVFAAMFTAGLVDRLLGPRLIGLIGPRVLPRSGHVIVVGLGQVGLRLCRELMLLGVRVVGVERDPEAENLRLARLLNIPVVTGHGGDRGLLERLAVHRARAVAAVGSDDLDNIAVAIAVHAVSPRTRLILRAGEHETIVDTRSLLRLGAVVRDVSLLTAVYVVESLLGSPPHGVVSRDSEVFVETGPGRFFRYDLNRGPIGGPL